MWPELQIFRAEIVSAGKSLSALKAHAILGARIAYKPIAYREFGICDPTGPGLLIKPSAYEEFFRHGCKDPDCL